MQEQSLVKKLWSDITAKVNCDENTKDFITQYKILQHWLKDHERYLKIDSWEKERLDILFALDPERYIIQEQGFFPGKNANKLQQNLCKERIKNIISCISSHMWEMVAIPSNTGCMLTDSDMRYVICESVESKEKQLALECDSCGWLSSLPWEKLTAGKMLIFPARKEEILKYADIAYICDAYLEVKKPVFFSVSRLVKKLDRTK